MKNDVDTKMLLRVYEKITSLGVKSNDGHCFEGVTAFSDFDGYTIFLQDAKVSLSYGFHNTYHFEYSSNSDFTDFLKKLRNIDTN